MSTSASTIAPSRPMTAQEAQRLSQPGEAANTLAQRRAQIVKRAAVGGDVDNARGKDQRHAECDGEGGEERAPNAGAEVAEGEEQQWANS